MRKHAFTLIELIFVIIIMGILTGIGFYLSRPNYAKQDAQYTLLKLKEARYRATGYEGQNTNCSEGGWITLDKAALNSASDNQGSTHHEIKSEIKISDNTITTICFDSLGRPHDANNTALSTLLQQPIDINFTNNDKNSTIKLFPQSGYATINDCKNL